MSWKREPLVHFLLIGAALFLLSALVGGDGATSGEETITVGADDIEWLKSAWARQWRRPPTERELQGLVDNHIREEILYREALAMGLDRDDTIVRRRLVQKIEFLTEDLIDQLKPSEEELRRFFDENVESYRNPELRTFTHVYFSVDSRGESAVADAAAVLAGLSASGNPPQRAPELGDRFMMQCDYPRRSETEVARHMGQEFARELFEVEPGRWQGPIRSGYGVHLALVSEVMGSSLPRFEEVRERVREDLQRQRRELANQGFYDGLRQRYEIVIDQAAITPAATKE